MNADELLKVAVLRGGTSAERDVSLKTGAQIVAALDRQKYSVTEIDTSDLPALAALSKSERPDIVIIALHGPGGEDGTVQGFLEVLGIKYTGSGVLASALAMDKVLTKTLLAAHGIAVPKGLVYTPHDTVRLAGADCEIGDTMDYPVVVKPSRQGSTYGTSIVRHRDQLSDALTFAFRYDSTVLVEECIVGTEITVAVLGNDHNLIPLPIVEIVAKHGFFDYEAKYSCESGAVEIVPARIGAGIAQIAQEIATDCHRILGCVGMSRTDMFVRANGSVVVLETNTIPGMTETSLLPKAAQAAGISFADLLDRLIGFALDAEG